MALASLPGMLVCVTGGESWASAASDVSYGGRTGALLILPIHARTVVRPGEAVGAVADARWCTPPGVAWSPGSSYLVDDDYTVTEAVRTFF